MRIDVNKKPIILVIDDDPSSIDVLSAILREDYKVIAATSGIKGLQLANKTPPPDLILLDVKMKGLDGYDTCKELKSSSDTGDIPVIFVTADANIESEQHGLLLGAVDYITKPFNALLVKARIHNHIVRKYQHDELGIMIHEATTEIKKGREKLESSEKLYRTLMESSPDSIILINDNGEIQLANKTVTSMFGYDSEELKGQKIEILVPDKFVKGHPEIRNKYIEQPYDKSDFKLSMLSAKKKDGSVFPVEVHLTHVVSGENRMIIANVRDTTEQQQMQNQLRQAQKMEAIGQLTGGIAHDFNNILNSILGFSALALQNEEIEKNEVLKRYLSVISQSGERARDLVKQMLAFSRGNMSGDFIVVKLLPLLEEVMNMMQPILPSSINFNINIDSDAANILADPVQINQIIMNLCINARDALQEKGTIILGLRKVHLNNNECSSCHNFLNDEFIEISVKDDGMGVSAESVTKIFDPFYSTKDVGKGTGMGLSVVHGIVHNHGGHIIVDSMPGEGATFRMLFPILPIEQTESLKEKEQDALLVEGNNKRLMVVDDEEIITLYLETLLSDMGFVVTRFTNSINALEYFNEHQDDVDLIITDQTMPGMTGYEMSEHILKIKPNIPIIMATGYSALVDAKSAHELGIKSFIIKPYEQSELIGEIKTLLHL